MTKRNPQLKLLKDEPKAYGGDLLKKRKGRERGRPLDTKHTMHLILRSSKAIGERSFAKPQNRKRVAAIIQKFSNKYGVKVHSMANVGNHLHLQIKIANRYAYKAFIRATTAAIAMAIMKVSRWNKTSSENPRENRFWDCRPYTRVVIGRRAFLTLQDYIQINRLEGFGFCRASARFFLESKGWALAESG